MMTVYLARPDGPRLKNARVIKIDHGFADQVHPGKRHRWHEMTHYGEPGTGFSQCRCGAIGVIRWKDAAATASTR